jgi:glycosyltransferase involved in cell wall biosynthesis
MSECEVFVVPSMRAPTGDLEGGPLTHIEAMATGAAVVASRLPGTEAVITDGVDGLLVPPGSVDSLRSAIVRLHTDGALRATIEHQAPTTADRHSVERRGAELLAILDELVG